LDHPFEGDGFNALARNIMSGKRKPIPGVYSSGMSQLVNWLLRLDPAHRPTAKDILSHPYVASYLPFLPRCFDAYVPNAVLSQSKTPPMSFDRGNANPNINDRYRSKSKGSHSKGAKLSRGNYIHGHGYGGDAAVPPTVEPRRQISTPVVEAKHSKHHVQYRNIYADDYDLFLLQLGLHPDNSDSMQSPLHIKLQTQPPKLRDLLCRHVHATLAIQRSHRGESGGDAAQIGAHQLQLCHASPDPTSDTPVQYKISTDCKQIGLLQSGQLTFPHSPSSATMTQDAKQTTGTVFTPYHLESIRYQLEQQFNSPPCMPTSPSWHIAPYIMYNCVCDAITQIMEHLESEQNAAAHFTMDSPELDAAVAQLAKLVAPSQTHMVSSVLQLLLADSLQLYYIASA
jgi:serine/threonine protein kinase